MPTRRLILTSLPLALGSLAGCASPYPKQGLSTGSSSRVIDVREPRLEPVLKLKITDWARLISAASVKEEEAAINSALGSWSPTVIDSFTAALASSLQRAGFKVGRAPRPSQLAPEEGKDAAAIRCFLTAGFTYKTWDSAGYAPFVQVVLEAQLRNGAVRYHQLKAVSRRSLNLFETTTPPITKYEFAEIDVLRSEPEKALAALAELAAQLGRAFGEDLAS